MDSDEWFTLAELTKRIGGLVWVEEQMAELLETWARIEDHAPSAVHFATAAGHHRWHAETVRGCLPTSPQLLETDPVSTPTPGWQRAIERLAQITDPDATSVRLKALAKVLDPWLEREIGVLLELARPVSDAAMTRWLGFVAIDHDHDGQAVHDLLVSHADRAVRFEDHRVVSDLDLS